MRYRVHPAQARDPRLRATVGLIRRKIIDASINPKIFRFARDAVNAVPEHDELGEIGALIDAIRARVAYRRDPVGIETVADAHDTLEIGAGDCDDLTVLAGGALQSIGYPVEIELVGDRRLSHVRPIAKTKKHGKIPVDLARPDRRYTALTPAFPMRVSVPVGINQAQAKKKINQLAKPQREALKKQARAVGMTKADYLVNQAREKSGSVSINRPADPRVVAPRTVRYAIRPQVQPRPRTRTLKDFITASGDKRPWNNTNPAKNPLEQWSIDNPFRMLPRVRSVGELADDGSIGSWLSEGVKKVAGKKAGRALEKAANTMARTAVHVGASFIPGGAAIASAYDNTIEWGADPGKMSSEHIAQIAQTDPARAQAILQQKALTKAGSAVDKMPKEKREWLKAEGRKLGMTKDQYWAYLQSKGQLAQLQSQSGAPAPAYAGGAVPYMGTGAQKQSSGSMLPLLGLGLLAAKFL